MGEQRGTFSDLSAGYTVPNASCPVCGASVFFYQSPYGGRVFFDSLGPPWPKHACTTSDYVASGRGLGQGGCKSWHRDEWLTLSKVSISPGTSSGLYKISGSGDDWTTRQFYFAADELVMCEIVRFKQRASGEFYISILDYDTIYHRWQTWSGIAYVSADKAAAKVGALQKTIFPADAVPPRAKEPAGTDSGTLSAKENSTKAGDEFQRCPVCKQNVMQKNLRGHIRRLHSDSMNLLIAEQLTKMH